MTRNRLIILAAGGSLLLLLGAWGFQYLGGLAPCQMCYWQRWPHLVAVPIGVLAIASAGKLLPVLGTLAAATSGALGVFHTGVERGWWEGPSSCSAGDISGLSAEDLLDQIMTAPVVRCNEVAWEMLGLSMASWNAVASFTLALLWLGAMQLSAKQTPL